MNQPELTQMIRLADKDIKTTLNCIMDARQNTLDGPQSRLDIEKEKISEPEDIAIQTI